jgi:uncharacterized metal-binding protein YceD (DUF177 family)
MEDPLSEKPAVVTLDDIVRRLNALAGIRGQGDATLVLTCKKCLKPYKFCGCQDRVVGPLMRQKADGAK